MIDINKLERELVHVEIEPHTGTLSIREGLQLLAQLDEGFKPFLIKYTALVNKTKRHIPVTPAQIGPFILIAEQLSNCTAYLLSAVGCSYLHAMELMINGFNEDDAEDKVFELYAFIKLTDSEGLYSLFTY